MSKILFSKNTSYPPPLLPAYSSHSSQSKHSPVSVAARVQVVVDDGRQGEGPAGGDTHHGVAGPRGEGGRYTAVAARADDGPRRGRSLSAHG